MNEFKEGDRDVTIAEIERLRAALRLIADGRGRCGSCGRWCEGSGSGTIPLDCEKYGPGMTSPCFWTEADPTEIAKEALKYDIAA